MNISIALKYVQYNIRLLLKHSKGKIYAHDERGGKL